MSIGYACIALGVPGGAQKSCLKKNADEKTLSALISHNLEALESVINYNMRNGIRLFRISSDLIPFGSSPVNTLDWEDMFANRFAQIGEKIRKSHMRVSMHPGQYTVLNALDADTVNRAVLDIEYHVRLLDALGLDGTHKVILHVGGVYGDKAAAVARFAQRYKNLDARAKRRLVIENDDRLYHIADVLELGTQLGIPVVFDNLHHEVNRCESDRTDTDWISACADTWTQWDGRQKIHYSQQDTGKKAGSHAASIQLDAFLTFYERLGSMPPDIMLEVKDKNISAIKCQLCVDNTTQRPILEREWGRYKYLVLERSPTTYNTLRVKMREAAYPPAAFYHEIENALKQECTSGNAINALLHVWGYFKECSTAREKADFLKQLDGYRNGSVSLFTVKRRLYKLAAAYKRDYLLDSYYFIEQL